MGAKDGSGSKARAIAIATLALVAPLGVTAIGSIVGSGSNINEFAGYARTQAVAGESSPKAKSHPVPRSPTETWGLDRGWTELPEPPVPRARSAQVWTGAELIVVGGDSNYGGMEHSDAFSFDPVARTWDRLADAPLDLASQRAVWTGEEVLIWGASYSPATDRWTSSNVPIGYRSPIATVWTGSEMIVWGDFDRHANAVDGAAFDPNTDTWRRIADAPLPINLGDAVWTGEEMIVFGSILDGNNHSEHRYAQGMAYDPVEDRWRALPESRLSPQASSIVWSGEEVIAWDYELQTSAYNPASDSWKDIPDAPMEFSECYPDSAATDEGLFAHFCSQIAYYDFERNDWARIDPPVHIYGDPVATDDAFFLIGASHESTDNAAWVYHPPKRLKEMFPPPRFLDQRGWQLWTSGATPDGDSPSAWASTVRLPISIPHRHLHRLGPRDIALHAFLVTPSDDPNYPEESFPRRKLPLDLKLAEKHRSFQAEWNPDIPAFLLLARAGGHRINLWVYFGSPDPTDKMWRRAQGMIETLYLPDPWMPGSAGNG